MRRARVLTGLAAPVGAARAVATIGVFDGVHRAHQQLIRTAVRMARRLRATSVVVTFDPDPHAVLDPADAPPALMPLEERLRLLAGLGVDRIWVIPFTRRFARMSAEEFIARLLARRLRAAALIVGSAFLFGRNRRGDLAVLRRLGPRYGMRVVPVRDIRRGGAAISSSRIRRCIAAGRLADARRLLGRPPAVYGAVVRGAGRGRRLGFPTANLRVTSGVVPPRGVYAVIVRTAGSRAARRGVMNIGIRPTFGSGPAVCEVHLLGFSGTLLRRRASVSLIARLRGERRFHRLEALQRQIRRDIIRARRLLRHLP
jgi:riboflavin kinase/FMN adenylyltransferase